MQIEKFDKPTLAHFRTKIQDALDAVGKELGITIQMANISFNEFEFRSKIEAKIPGKEIDYSEKYAFMGLAKLGTEFKNGGKIFKVVRHEIGRPKYPIVAEGPDGKLYKFPAEFVTRTAIVKA